MVNAFNDFSHQNFPFLMTLIHWIPHWIISFVFKCLYGKYDVDSFDYFLLHSRHKNTFQFCHTYARIDCFKFTVFNRVPAYLINFLKIFGFNFFLVSQVRDR